MEVKGTKIASMACVVPDESSEVQRVKQSEQLQKVTGVKSRRKAADEVCTSDLCVAAARLAIKSAGLSNNEIKTVIFVSQTPDYVLPATSCVIQHRLGLPRNCAAFDINQGCSGYVYGLWVAASIISTGGGPVLLLVGDTISKITTGSDAATESLFGDAGSATVLVPDADADPWNFCLGTDGSGFENIIVRSASFRGQQTGQQGFQPILSMNGADVFSFTLQAVPQLFTDVHEQSKLAVKDIDAVVMHQANAFMINHLQKKLGLNSAFVPQSIDKYGNTSSASIPLTICSELKDQLANQFLSVILLGFGVGLSWAGVNLKIGPFKELPIYSISEVKS